jgi:hypothetical protein
VGVIDLADVERERAAAATSTVTCRPAGLADPAGASGDQDGD